MLPQPEEVSFPGRPQFEAHDKDSCKVKNIVSEMKKNETIVSASCSFVYLLALGGDEGSGASTSIGRTSLSAAAAASTAASALAAASSASIV